MRRAVSPLWFVSRVRNAHKRGRPSQASPSEGSRIGGRDRRSAPRAVRRVNKSGKPIEAPGNSYTLNLTEQPHSAMIATENIALVIYSGKTDDVRSVEIVDIDPH